jgi:pimeloyl-ACP methyl ester carboxylesterase
MVSRATFAGMGVSAAWIAYSNSFVNHHHKIGRAIDAEPHTITTPSTGRLNYYVDRTGEGRPVVLIHSINAAASAYEMRPLFERLRGNRPVYALDLPGFGFSERSDREYTPELYVQSILALLQQLNVSGGADVVALSLGAEFAALAAQQRSDLVHSLTLISPTGFSNRSSDEEFRRQENSARIHRAFAAPLWSQPFYDLLTTRASINFFLDRLFVGPVDTNLLEYSYATTHQPGARHAPLYFVSGALFTPDVRNRVYAQIHIPVQVIYDEDDEFVDYDALKSFLAEHDTWQAQRVIPTRGLPQFEMPDRVMEILRTFWNQTAPVEAAH